MRNGFILILCVILAANISVALPSLTNNCGRYGVNLRLPSDSDIIAYNKECDTVFIGPPSAGSAEIVSLIPSSNLRFCTSVKKLPSVANTISTSIDYWAKKLSEIMSEMLLLEKDINEKRARLIDFEEEKRALDTELVRHQEFIQEMSNKAKETKQRLTECRDLAENAADCTIIETEFQNIKKEISHHRDTVISPIEEEITVLDQNTRALKRKLDQISEDIYSNTEIFEKYKQRLNAIKNEALEQYGLYGSLEGVTAQILFESQWQQQIERARRLNPFTDLHIEFLPITRSFLQVDTTMNDQNKLNFPSTLIYASLPGFISSGTTLTTTPKGDATIEHLDGSTHGTDSFISGASGRLVLSLIGSCELTNEQNQLQPKINYNTLSSYITINSVHEYPMLNERKHSVYFRASRFAEEVEKRTEKGGFFHTTSIHEIIKNSFSEDDFRVDFRVDTEEDAYTEQEKAILTQEAKKEVLDRVLKEIATVSKLKPSRAIVPGRLPQSGAARIYQQAECFGWIYCDVATFVVGVFDAIFGSSETVKSFKAKNSMVVNHTYTSQKPATYGFVTTFIPKS